MQKPPLVDHLADGKGGGGTTLTAVITHESANRLGLKVGSHACTLFDASSVITGVNT